jgi:hypothetical protein
MVTVEERLGDRFANNAHHGDAHKWLVVAWRQMEAAAAPSATVRLGDKGAGLAAHAEYCSSYIGDILIQTDDGKEIVELKNYTPFVTTDTRCPAACTLIGGQYLFGNTEERLKYRVIGTRRRGLPALGVYIHKLGTGHVAAHRGDYYDCIENRKARLHLITFEAGLGGMSPYAARSAAPAPQRPRGNRGRLRCDRLHHQPDGALFRAVLRATPLYGLRHERRARHPKVPEEGGEPPPCCSGGRVRGACPFHECT